MTGEGASPGRTRQKEVLRILLSAHLMHQWELIRAKDTDHVVDCFDNS